MTARSLPALTSCRLAVFVLVQGTASASARAASPPRAHASSPCDNHSEVASLVKEAEYPIVPGNFYTELSYCAKPFSVACAAQQFNPRHNLKVPFYKDRAVYHRCEGAYALVRARSSPRRYSTGLCAVISWAAIPGGPWVPEVTLPAKLGTVIFGVSLKLKCG